VCSGVYLCARGSNKALSSGHGGGKKQSRDARKPRTRVSRDTSPAKAVDVTLLPLNLLFATFNTRSRRCLRNSWDGNALHAPDHTGPQQVHEQRNTNMSAKARGSEKCE
jgi:hypothetical protein